MLNNTTRDNQLANKNKGKSYTLITINSVYLNKAINPLTLITLLPDRRNSKAHKTMLRKSKA
jgi:hypothetical protein